MGRMEGAAGARDEGRRATAEYAEKRRGLGGREESQKGAKERKKKPGPRNARKTRKGGGINDKDAT